MPLFRKIQVAPNCPGKPGSWSHGHMVTCLSGTLNRAGWREANVQGAAFFGKCRSGAAGGDPTLVVWGFYRDQNQPRMRYHSDF